MFEMETKKKKRKSRKRQAEILHLIVENVALVLVHGVDERNHIFVEDAKDVCTSFVELVLNLCAVGLELRDSVLVVVRCFLLLDRGHNAPGRTTCPDQVLERDGQQVALL